RVFCLLPIGDVEAETDMAQEVATRRKPGLGVTDDPAPGAIAAPYAGLGLKPLTVADGLKKVPNVSRRILRMQERLPFPTLHLYIGHSKEFAKRAVDEANPALLVGNPHERGTTVRHDAEAFFTFAQRILGPLAFSDVTGNAKDSMAAPVEGNQRRVCLDVHKSPIFAAQPEL